MKIISLYVSLFIMLASFFCSPVDGQVTFKVLNTNTNPGSSATAVIEISHDSDIQGYQIAMTSDSGLLTFDELGTTGLEVELLLAPATIEFFPSTGSSELSPGIGWLACAAIFDFSPPFEGQMLPAGIGQSALWVRFNSADDPSLINSCTTIDLVNGLGQPPITNIVTSGGSSIIPDLTSGDVCFVSIPAFRRGDANADSVLNIADAIFLIQHFFLAGPSPSCNDAANSNGDASLDLGDVITVINYQFLNGTPPPPPFPSCGLSSNGQTELGCAFFNGC